MIRLLIASNSNLSVTRGVFRPRGKLNTNEFKCEFLIFIKPILFLNQVGDRDTLTSVAARFDTTPSELTAINRLNSSFIYSGQQLLVPDKDADTGDDTGNSGTSSPTGDARKRHSSEELQQDENGKYKI